MNSSHDIFVGVDWSHSTHAIVLYDSLTDTTEEESLAADPQAINAWAQQLKERFPSRRIALCVELKRGALIYQLSQYDNLDIYPINPVTSARFRTAFKPSGAKDDFPDARVHLSILRQHRDKLTLWLKPANQDLRLSLLCENRRKLVDLQVDLRNRLRSTLRDYFPQALELAGVDLSSPMACSFLLRWSDLRSLKKTDKHDIRRFYYAHGSRRGDVIEKRLKLIENTLPVSEEPALIEPHALYVRSLVMQLQSLQESLTQTDNEITKAFSQHEDANLWPSFPGAGAALAPRLAIAWGSDRQRYKSAQDMQMYSGVSPVRHASGNRSAIFQRKHRPRFLHQTFWEHAKHSALHCSWAKAYVEDQVRRGKKRSSAYRSLAFKWQRIMHACWRNRTPYDDERYEVALKKSASAHSSEKQAA